MIPFNTPLAIPYGEKLAPTGSPDRIVDGLTTCRYLLVKPLSTNLGDLLITTRTGAGTGSGFRLKAVDAPVLLDLQYDNSLLRVQASANGSTICWIGVGAEGE